MGVRGRSGSGLMSARLLALMTVVVACDESEPMVLPAPELAGTCRDDESRELSVAARGGAGCERESHFERVVWLGDGRPGECDELKPWRCGHVVALSEMTLRGSRWSDPDAREALAAQYAKEWVGPPEPPTGDPAVDSRTLSGGEVRVVLWGAADHRRGVTTHRRYRVTVSADGTEVTRALIDESVRSHDRPVRR